MIARLVWLAAAGLLAAVMDVRFADAAAGLLDAATDARFADPAARDLVLRSRAAVAGSAAAENLRSLVMKGRRRVPLEGSDVAEGIVEIRIVLPDKFLRVDSRINSTGSTEHRSGFVGRTVLTAGGDLRRERAQLTRLMLGLAAYVSSDEALIVRSTGETAFADTAAVDVTGPGFSGRLVVDANAAVPLRVVYFAEGGVSTVMSFANRRVADGWELPFRITTQTPDRVLETLMLDEIHVNPDLTDRDFRR
jgi:hypothetical protein